MSWFWDASTPSCLDEYLYLDAEAVRLAWRGGIWLSAGRSVRRAGGLQRDVLQQVCICLTRTCPLSTILECPMVGQR